MSDAGANHDDVNIEKSRRPGQAGSAGQQELSVRRSRPRNICMAFSLVPNSAGLETLARHGQMHVELVLFVRLPVATHVTGIQALIRYAERLPFTHETMPLAAPFAFRAQGFAQLQSSAKYRWIWRLAVFYPIMVRLDPITGERN